MILSLHQHSPTEQSWSIVFFGEKIKGSGTITALSAEECTIQSSLPLQPGTHLSAQINSSNSAENIFINEATVRWVKKETCQFEFTDISEESQAKLQAIALTIQNERVGSTMPYCTRCGSHDVKRTPRIGVIEHIQSFLFWYPFRCRSCGDRFLFWQWGIRYLKHSDER